MCPGEEKKNLEPYNWFRNCSLFWKDGKKKKTLLGKLSFIA